MGEIFKVQNGLVKGDVSGGLETRYYGCREKNSQQTCPRLRPTAYIPLHQANLDLENFPHNATLYKSSVFAIIGHTFFALDKYVYSIYLCIDL